MKTRLTNLPQIGHLHLAGSPKRNFPGPGQATDFSVLVPAVLAAGYRGPWGVEFCGGADVLEEYVRAAELLRGFAGGKR